MSLLRKLPLVKNNRTTYQAGLLQAHAYRILKQKTTEMLAPYDISTIEWALLGLVYEEKTLRFSAIAEALGVEAPFVTEMAVHLKKKSLVLETKHAKDSRVKLLSLTAKGRSLVKEIEPVVRGKMRYLIAGVSARDLLGYLTVLESIIEKGN